MNEKREGYLGKCDPVHKNSLHGICVQVKCIWSVLNKYGRDGVD